MGAGIAVEFKKRYGSIQVLLQPKKRSWSSCSTTKRKVNFLHRY
ncbi:'031R [Invertebrate iridescent virus Kaz2018]|nr:'031R [Invertebrate iridescent virus Kaz2018]